MISHDKISDQNTTTRRMNDLINRLSLDEQRILAKLINNWENRDQRTHPRTQCSIVTDYAMNKQSHRALIRNISLGGAFIESAKLSPLNTYILQSFFFPNFEIPIHSKSKIVWRNPHGFGVQFEILDDKG